MPPNRAAPAYLMQPSTTMRGVFEDARFGARLLARTPGFTVAALVTLALGIGVNAALFSLADAIFLRPLSVADPSRVVHVYQNRDRSGAFPMSLSDYRYYQEQSRSFVQLAAHYPTAPLHVIVDGEPFAVSGSVVTANYFRVLELQPALGRFFLDTEDAVPDRDAVLVVSHAFWQQRFQENPQVLGRTISVNGRPFSIVGVAPPGFGGVLQGIGTSDLWIPSAMVRVGTGSATVSRAIARSSSSSDGSRQPCRWMMPERSSTCWHVSSKRRTQQRTRASG